MSAYGPPQKLLIDSGGEFNNDEVRHIVENFNTKIKPAAMESRTA